MFEGLLVHKQTARELQAFMQVPGHNVLLLGKDGSGKRTLAERLLTQILEVPFDALNNKGSILLIEPQKQVISISEIRRCQEFVRLKTVGQKSLRRAILIDTAGCMTTEAQNAFLKLLEEPPKDTIIIMTATSKEGLLPTILSRVPKITVRPISMNDALEHFARDASSADITRSYYLSGGLPGLMHDLLHGNKTLLSEHIDMVKKFLQVSPFDRLVMVDQLSKQKDSLPYFLWAMRRVSDTAMKQAISKDNKKAVQHWLNIQKTLLAAEANLAANPQPKLLLSNLALHI